MKNKIPAYIYSVSYLADEIKSNLNSLTLNISNEAILNLISLACKYKSYESLEKDNQDFKIENSTKSEIDFRTKYLFSAKSLDEVIPEIKKFIQTLRIYLLNGYRIHENHNKYFTLFLPELIEKPKKKTHNHCDVIIEDLDSFILNLKQLIDQKFSINFDLDRLILIVGKQITLNIESKSPVEYYKNLYNELYCDVQNNDWFSPKRIYSIYDENSENGEKIGLIELTFKMIAYKKAIQLNFDFTDQDNVEYGDSTMLSNQ